MIKRTHIYLAVCILLLIAAAGGIIMSIGKNTEKTGVLFVDGKESANVSARIREKDAILPFTEVLKGFGFNITWRDRDAADITYENKTYVLDLKGERLTGEETNRNLLITTGGSGQYRKVEGRELFIDSNTIRSVMYDLGKKIDINIERNKLIIYVDTEVID